jgi:YbgC/YbaW family acyl-CoA thioester hydrolase
LNRNPDFQTAINVRFNDIDAMGHVNNAVMFTYFEEGRKALFLERLKGVKGGGFNFILAHIQCDYLLPVRLEDRPVLKMTVSAIGGKSFGLSYVLVKPPGAVNPVYGMSIFRNRGTYSAASSMIRCGWRWLVA